MSSSSLFGLFNIHLCASPILKWLSSITLSRCLWNNSLLTPGGDLRIGRSKFDVLSVRYLLLGVSWNIDKAHKDACGSLERRCGTIHSALVRLLHTHLPFYTYPFHQRFPSLSLHLSPLHQGKNYGGADSFPALEGLDCRYGLIQSPYLLPS